MNIFGFATLFLGAIREEAMSGRGRGYEELEKFAGWGRVEGETEAAERLRAA